MSETIYSVSFTVTINGRILKGEFDYRTRYEARTAIRKLERNSKRLKSFNLDGIITIKN